MKFPRAALKNLVAIVSALGFVAAPLAFAYASVSVSIQSLSPSTSVSVGTTVSFNLSATGFTNPTYTVTDPTSNNTVTNNDMSSTGNFSWTPENADIGMHNLTITVNDSLGDTATTQESITVTAAPTLAIQSLSPSSSVTAGQTVTFSAAATGFTNPTFSVSDSLNGSSVSNSDINTSTGAFSWTPSSNQTGTHVITIYATDSLGHSASATETITVGSAPTVVIQSLSPSSGVNVGQNVSFSAAASNFSSPTYSVSDSFSGSTVSNSDINASGYFSWTPASADAGTHTITVTVTDTSGHTATATQTIVVGSGGTVSGTGGATIQGLEPGSTVIVGQPVTFTVAASGFSNPVFTAQDAFSGTSMTNSAINSAGYFSWTPDSNDVGTHNIMIYVNDSSGHTSNVTISITVDTPNITITSINPGTTVLPQSPLSFVVTPAGFTNPTYTASDSFSGTSVSNSNINSSGDFSWTPTTAQDGSHTITIYATDSSGHSANTSITINVNSGVSVVLTAPSPNSSVGAGTAVTLQAYAYGFTNPTYTMQDSFNSSSLLNSDINSSGDLYWIPTNADAGEHTITITATDAYGHVASAETTITVAANSNNLTTATAPASAVMFTEDLGLGVTSSQVTELQATLKALGLYSGPITGYYGSLTQAAVEEFQGAHGIEQIGSVGPQTRAELNTLLSGSSTATATTTSTAGDGYVFNNFLGLGSTGTDVTELQKRLTTLGDYSGPVTGYFGDLTRAAVETFQGVNGIDQVGYVGPGTRAALNK